MKNQTGASFIEILISLLLSSFIVILLVQLYLNSKSQYLKAEKIMSSSLEWQWVSDLLSNSFRRAGFTPCLSIDQLELRDARGNKKIIHGLEIINKPLPYIQINRMHERFTKVLDIQSPTHLAVAHGGFFKKNRPILIADCVHAEIHQPVNLVSYPGGLLIFLDRPLFFNYRGAVYVGEFVEEKWFIKKNPRDQAALYYQVTHPEEVSDLISSFAVASRKNGIRQLLEMKITMANGKKHKLLVTVRGS